MRKLWLWIFGISGFGFAILIGMWSKALFTVSESIHFSVNFPTGEGVPASEVLDCCEVGGPWARLHSSEFEGYPPGGVLVWGTEGKVLVDLGKLGTIKRVVQPGFLNLSSHWVRNLGTRPYRIRFDMQLCGLEMEWVTPESAWDPVTRTTTRVIEPGETYNMDWYVHIPPERLNQPAICEGSLELFDADTQASLSVLPISIINSSAE